MYLLTTDWPVSRREGPMGRQIQDPVVVGIDVGSTTVKAVVLDPETLEILWRD